MITLLRIGIVYFVCVFSISCDRVDENLSTRIKIDPKGTSDVGQEVRETTDIRNSNSSTFKNENDLPGSVPDAVPGNMPPGCVLKTKLTNLIPAECCLAKDTLGFAAECSGFDLQKCVISYCL